MIFVMILCNKVKSKEVQSHKSLLIASDDHYKDSNLYENEINKVTPYTDDIFGLNRYASDLIKQSDMNSNHNNPYSLDLTNMQDYITKSSFNDVLSYQVKEKAITKQQIRKFHILKSHKEQKQKCCEKRLFNAANRTERNGSFSYPSKFESGVLSENDDVKNKALDLLLKSRNYNNDILSCNEFSDYHSHKFNQSQHSSWEASDAKSFISKLKQEKKERL